MTTIVFILFAVTLFVLGWQLGAQSNRTVQVDELRAIKAELRAEMQQLLASREGASRTAASAISAPEAPAAHGVAQGAAHGAASSAAAPRPEAPPGQGVTDGKTIAILAATVAAYLGKQVRVRQARLLDGRSAEGQVSSWAQAGRVSIQGSHVLGRR